MRPACYPLLLVLLAIAGCTKPSPPRTALSTEARADMRMRDVEERKDEMLRELSMCESGGVGDSAQPIYGGRGAFVGRFQFTPRTVINYVQQMDGRILSVKEAVALAHDYRRAAALAKFVIFEKDGVWNWPLCSRKLGLVQQVADIKSFASETMAAQSAIAQSAAF
ncbi:MAG: hypothetical protein OJF58_003212 [Enhydrobacter sp.]|nr:MAG: hypothetical protein OJF58_003212 [Enhydrobacter sp.]